MKPKIKKDEYGNIFIKNDATKYICDWFECEIECVDCPIHKFWKKDNKFKMTTLTRALNIFYGELSE